MSQPSTSRSCSVVLRGRRDSRCTMRSRANGSPLRAICGGASSGSGMPSGGAESGEVVVGSVIAVARSAVCTQAQPMLRAEWVASGSGHSSQTVAVLAHGAQHQHFAGEAGDASRREVDDRHHLAPDERGGIWIGHRQLGGAVALADLRAEVDPQLVGGLARLREGLRRQHATDAHVHAGEIVELDHRRTVAGSCFVARRQRPCLVLSGNWCRGPRRVAFRHEPRGCPAAGA